MERMLEPIWWQSSNLFWRPDHKSMALCRLEGVSTAISDSVHIINVYWHIGLLLLLCSYSAKVNFFVLIYRLTMLKGHTMAVTSVDWSVLDGLSLLASTSDDQVLKNLVSLQWHHLWCFCCCVHRLSGFTVEIHLNCSRCCQHQAWYMAGLHWPISSFMSR